MGLFNETTSVEFFKAASGYHHAARLLAPHVGPIESNSNPSSLLVVQYYVFALAWELYLKAYLNNKSISVRDLQKEYGHDLEKLLTDSKVNGLTSSFPNVKMSAVDRIVSSLADNFRDHEHRYFRPTTALTYFEEFHLALLTLDSIAESIRSDLSRSGHVIL